MITIVMHKGDCFKLVGEKGKNAPYVIAVELDGGVVNRLDNNRNEGEKW